jgi:transcriptional regulator with XRE-family HTH domain
MGDKTIASRFRSAFLAARMGLIELALAANLGKQTLYQFEAGYRGVSLENLWNLCVAMGYDPHTADERLCPRPGSKPSPKEW